MTFDDAAIAVKTLRKTPDPATLLRLYGLFKQGGAGDVAGDRPGVLDIRGRAKFDAWKALEGTPQSEAQAQYVALVSALLASDGGA